MPRMRILNAADQARFENPPDFNNAERKRYFDFSQPVTDEARKLRSPSNHIGFLLAYGYFRAVRRFFSPELYRGRDIAYIARAAGFSPDRFVRSAYNERTRLNHQRRILDLQGFRPFDPQAEARLVPEIAKMARLHLKPRMIFLRCTDFLAEKRIQIPGERRLTDLIRAQLSVCKNDLISLADMHLPPDLRALLDSLFEQDDGMNRYRLTLLKRIPQSTRPGKIKETSADFEILADLHRKITPVLETIGLSSEGIRYYAGGVRRGEMFQLRRRSDADRHLHAIAFIADQHRRHQDALVDMLLSVMRSFETTVGREHREEMFARRKTDIARIKKMLDVADAEIFGPMRDIRALVENEAMSDARKVEGIRAILGRGPDAADRLREGMRSIAATDDSEIHQIIENRSMRLQNRISPILRRIALIGSAGAADLTAALEHFRDKGGDVGPTMPLAFLTPAERDAVSNDPKGFRVSLCKAFLFRHVAAAIKAGTLNLEGSYKYRPLDDYLISRERWTREKRELIERSGLTEFTDVKSVLKDIGTVLHRRYGTANRSWDNGTNPHLKIRASGDFRIATPALADTESEPLRDIMPEQGQVQLSEILATVDHHCGMLGEFRHWQQVNVDPAPLEQAIIIADVMGLGCAIGVQRMARISHAVSERELEYAVNWRFSAENIAAANDRVAAAMDRMELPQIHRRSREALHTSSDGQKFEILQPSLNASYSFKYFGQGQGVSAYTFIDERSILWHSLVFSAAERESAYVIDGLMHNDVVKSDIHSTDEHGFTEAIFCVTHLLGISYAPRFRNLKKQTIYGFRSRRGAGTGWRISPDKYVNEKAILASWDDLLRLVAAIRLKEAAASDIFRRLNSYSRQHSLYAAMKAFGRIIKSLFILSYIDQVELRQAIEKQLNKVELANAFTRAVAVGNPRGLEHAEKSQQEIAEGCNRLIKNSIICWNYLYLTREVGAAKTRQEREKLLRTIALHSPQSWGHVNMLGEYDFSKDRLRDNTGVLSPKSDRRLIPEGWEPPKR